MSVSENMDGNEIEGCNKPQTGSEVFYTHQWIFAGYTSNRHPRQISIDDAADGMTQDVFVDALSGKQFEKQEDEHSKEQWLCGQVHAYITDFQFFEIDAKRCAKGNEENEIFEMVNGSPAKEQCCRQKHHEKLLEINSCCHEGYK